MGKMLAGLLNSTISRDRYIFGWVSLGGGVVPPEPANGAYGFDAEIDEGTAGDLFVSASGSNTTGDGTLAAPYATISHAITNRGARRTIKVRGGIYRETVNLNGLAGTAEAPISVSRYGAEPVIISGFEAHQGWADCDAADAAVVGANWAQMKKKTLPASTFVGSNPLAANIHEGGFRLRLATTKQPFIQFPWTDNALKDWAEAGSAVVAAGKLAGYVLPALVAEYGSALVGRSIMTHISNNTANMTTIASIDGDNVMLADQTRTYESNANRNKFCILNLPGEIKRGGWAFSVSGSDVTLYVWPNSAASASFDVSARGAGVTMRGSSFVGVRGLIIEGVASAETAQTEHYAVVAANTAGSAPRDGLVIENNLIRRTWRKFDGYGAIWLRHVTNHKVQRNSIEEAVGQFGYFSQGTGYGQANPMNSGERFLRNKVWRSDKAPARIYGAQDGICGGNLFLAAGQASHSNKGNVYEGGWRYLFHRNLWLACDGYLAWQEASSVHTIMNFIPSGIGSDARSVQDQNHDSTKSPATQLDVDEIGYVLNNALMPYKDAVAGPHSLALGYSLDPRAKYHALNNIMHGYAYEVGMVPVSNGNLLTMGSTIGGADAASNLAAVWEDVATGDLRIKASSPSWSMPAVSLSTIIAELSAVYPDYAADLLLDLAGNTFNPAAPFVGPYAPGSAQIGFDPIWVEDPKVSGVSVVGGVLTATPGYVLANPRPPISRQWLVTFDGWETFSEIPGATGSTFTIGSAQLGGQIGLRSRASGVEAVTLLSSFVTEGYPLGDPVRLGGTVTSATASAFTVPGVVFTGKPVLLVVNTRNGSTTADNALTITCGAGSFVATAGKARRSAVEVQTFLLAAPTPGTFSIEIAATLAANSSVIEVFEVDGLASVDLLGTGGSTANTGWAQSVATTRAETGVMFLFGRLTADPANPITLGGQEMELYNRRTADSAAAQQIAAAAGYKTTEIVGSYSITAAWPISTGATSFWLAIELRPSPIA